MLEEVFSALHSQTSGSAGPMGTHPQCCRVALILQSWCWSWEERLPGLADSSGDVSDFSPVLVSGVNSCFPFLSPSFWDPEVEVGREVALQGDSSHWCETQDLSMDFQMQQRHFVEAPRPFPCASPTA